MKSAALGRHISGAEVTNVSKHGFWLLLANEELFVAFKDFPWFKDATIAEIVRVEWPQPHHLYWPDLDVDLAVESIRHPENFPLISKKTRPPSVRTDERRSSTASTSSFFQSDALQQQHPHIAELTSPLPTHCAATRHPLSAPAHE